MTSAAPDAASFSKQIAEALVSIDGVGFCPAAPLRFKSGILSPVYCDNRRFPFHPAAWASVIAGFQRIIAEQQLSPDVIGGVEAAGIPHSAALGFAMHTPSIFIRKTAKDHGTKKRVEGGDVAGLRVLLVEDLITTGSSSLAAIQALREEGAIVTDCLCIISYGFAEATAAFAAANVTLHAATDFATVLAAAQAANRVDAATAATVAAWLADPHDWAAVHAATGPA